MRSRSLFHIVEESQWAQARQVGEYRPASLAAEGFVHCSFAGQVAGTAQLHYAGVTGLVVLELDPALLAAPVRVEDSSGRGTEFPHVYGPIPIRACVAVHPLTREDTGRFSFG